MGIFDYIATVNFSKEQFDGLIDVDGRLDAVTRQHFWEEYLTGSQQNLIIFYRSLNGEPIPEYLKQSMNHFFYLKALEFIK